MTVIHIDIVSEPAPPSGCVYIIPGDIYTRLQRLGTLRAAGRDIAEASIDLRMEMEARKQEFGMLTL